MKVFDQWRGERNEAVVKLSYLGKTLYEMIGTVLCKSNDSEFRRISTKFYEILCKSAKFRGERIFGEIALASIVSPLTKFRADVRNFTWQIR